MTARAPIIRHSKVLFSTARTRTTLPRSLSIKCRYGGPTLATHIRAFSISSSLYLRKYSEDHEWVEIDGNKATIGISQYAAKSLGDVVYVEVPTQGSSFAAHDTVGAVESVKAASDIMTPVAGTVVEVNEELEGKPKLINEDPEGSGWIAKLEVEEGEELENELAKLMDSEAYKEFTEAND